MTQFRSEAVENHRFDCYRDKKFFLDHGMCHSPSRLSNGYERVLRGPCRYSPSRRRMRRILADLKKTLRIFSEAPK
jgi:hypothetical protein